MLEIYVWKKEDKSAETRCLHALEICNVYKQDLASQTELSDSR
jgi:hypothetical protein